MNSWFVALLPVFDLSCIKDGIHFINAHLIEWFDFALHDEGKLAELTRAGLAGGEPLD